MNAPADSESTLPIPSRAREHLEVLRSTGGGYQSVSEVSMMLPDRFTVS